ncbi:very low-density lipoprotein receptor-like [Littorina saxatilis]|uniref:Uncharacterized protein n=1 Tax=Littorina saxatilis TaxID=31220 RepID=A0AAN9G7R0_9CAEN
MMKAVLLFLCIVAIKTVSAAAQNITLGTTSTPSSTSTPTNQNGNTTFVAASTRAARPTTTQAPELSLDENCGKSVSVKWNSTTYHAYNRSEYWSDCTVHFQRADQGKIQLTARFELKTSLCHVNVLNGNNRSSLINGPFITPYSHARSTITSGASGKLSVSVQGQLCAYVNLSISVREACPALASFPCDNDKCLPQSFVCDGFDNCGDNSDESHCRPRCPEFTCTNGNCVPWSYKCDGDNDCHDNSDEANCHTHCSEFTCTNGHCVPKSFECDGGNDCGDNSDEANCPTTCPEFTCTNGHCVPKSYECDGDNDCGDNSDETYCPTTCSTFTCANGHCVSWSDRCDDYDDCGDYSDESGCTTFYWSGGAYAGISIGVFAFFSIITGLFFYRRRRMAVAGPRILIPHSQARVVQSRW